MSISEYPILRKRLLFWTGSVFKIQFSCEKKLQEINLFNRADRPRWDTSFWPGCYKITIFLVGLSTPGYGPVSLPQKQLEMTVKIKTKISEKLMKHCRMRISNIPVIYSAVILVMAIHSLKMKQNVRHFCFASSQAVKCWIDITIVLTAIL